jgi:hypothetical protein
VKGLFWLLVCANVVVLLGTAAFARDQPHYFDYRPGAFEYLSKTTRWEWLIPIVSGVFILSAGIYWFACAWLDIDAYPGREAEAHSAPPLHKRLFSTPAGWTVILCLFGVVAGTAPWALVTVGSSRLLYPAFHSDLAALVLAAFVLLGLLTATTSSVVLVPRCPPALVVLTGGAVALLAGLYIALNWDVRVPGGKNEPFYRPWSSAHSWPSDGTMATISLRLGPFLALALGVGIALLGIAMLRRQNRSSRSSSGN